MKIYTKTGDKGETSLADGRRVSKSDKRLFIYGHIDQVNAHLGVLKAYMNNDGIRVEILDSIQRILFVLGALAASDESKWDQLKMDYSDPKIDQHLESEIDKMDLELTPLRSFILPFGTLSASYAHVVRTEVRSLERDIYSLDFEILPLWGKIFLNRLSDYLFVLSRYLNLKANVSELPWLP